jgi:hypothetical protein
VEAIEFCLHFVLTCIELAKLEADVFYRPVARIFMTIAVGAPMLFVTYHMIFLGKLPIGFIQFRNVILGASAAPTEDPPPMGFGFSEQMKAAGMDKLVLDHNRSAAKMGLIINILGERKTEEGLLPPIVWQFVLFCLITPLRNITDFFVRVCDSFLGDDVRWVLVALIDQIRYRNAHTRLAIEIVKAIFNKCSDNVRELVIVELMRRVMCVTPPPANVLRLMASIHQEIGPQFDHTLASRGATQFFSEAKEFSRAVHMSRWSSALSHG